MRASPLVLSAPSLQKSDRSALGPRNSLRDSWLHSGLGAVGSRKTHYRLPDGLALVDDFPEIPQGIQGIRRDLIRLRLGLGPIGHVDAADSRPCLFVEVIRANNHGSRSRVLVPSFLLGLNSRKRPSPEPNTEVAS